MLIAGILGFVIYFLIKAREKRQGTKPTAAVHLENPVFTLSRDEAVMGLAIRSHEAVNPLYSMEQLTEKRGAAEEEQANVGPRKFNLPQKKHWLPGRGQKREYRLEMSHITKLGNMGASYR